MHFYFLSFYFILFWEKVTFSSHPLSLACALLPICSAVMHKQDNPSGFSNKSYNPFTSKWVIKSSGVKWRGPRASVPYSGPCVLEPRARGDRIRVPVWNSELERGGKRRKVWETSVWRGGDRDRGGRNGLQDKPTFLKTPWVVGTGAKQPQPLRLTWLHGSSEQIRISQRLFWTLTGWS